MSLQEDRGLSWPCEITCEKQDPKSIECDQLRFANHSAAFAAATELPKETETERIASKSKGVKTGCNLFVGTQS